MRSLLKRLISHTPAPSGQLENSVLPCDVSPDAPFLAVGDVHGRLDLLQTLLSAHDPYNNRTLVFLGDYIDRGPSSAGVLDLLHGLATAGDRRVICLKGNHEQMMIDFIDDPLGRGAGWLMNGGGETLQSFGIAPPKRGGDLVAASEALEQTLPKVMADWLRGLPLRWQSGNICCVHAAMDPAVGPSQQRSNTMLWGHPQFLTTPRRDGLWVIHGHTIMKKPQLATSRISIDTGAYRTDQLTAAEIGPGTCRFVSA